MGDYLLVDTLALRTAASLVAHARELFASLLVRILVLNKRPLQYLHNKRTLTHKHIYYIN